MTAAVLNGVRADNPVQKGWDVKLRSGKTVQAKYLANPADGPWKNWRHITFSGEEPADYYALLVVLDLSPVHLLIFRRGSLRRLYDKLAKRHADKGERLNFTQTNYEQITEKPDDFKGLVEVHALKGD